MTVAFVELGSCRDTIALSPQVCFPLLYKLTENLAEDKGVFESIRIGQIIGLKPGKNSVL